MDTAKIIIGTVGGGRYTRTAPIIKEDYGLYLKIEGLNLPATYEVDFSNDITNCRNIRVDLDRDESPIKQSLQDNLVNT